MKTIVLVISIFTFSALFANNNDEPKMFSVTGKVMDNKEALVGVKITVDGEDRIVYTDLDGNFILNGIVEGEHTISFSMVTYDNKEIVFNPKSGENLIVELKAK